MADLTATGTFVSLVPHLGFGKLIVETPATADAADTIVITLGSYGISRLLGVTEHYHDTSESAVQNMTGVNKSATAVSSGVLTITLGTGTDKKRVFEILGK